MYESIVYYIIIYIIVGLLLALLPIWLIIKLIKSAQKKNKGEDPNWYLKLAVSPQDMAVQFFTFLGICFTWVFLLKLNQKLSTPIDGQYILLFISALCFFIGYRFKIISGIIWGMVSFMISFFWQIVALWVVNPTQMIGRSGVGFVSIVISYLFIGIIFYLLGRFHEGKVEEKRLSTMYLIWGIMVSVMELFSLSLNSEFLRDSVPISYYGSVLMTYFVIFSLLIIALLWINNKNRKMMMAENIFILIALVVFSINAFAGTTEGFSIITVVIANLLLLFEAVGVLIMGYYKGQDWYINFGTWLVFFVVIIKYFDWFSFLDRSAYFIGAGATFFVLGLLLERARRKMLADLKTREAN